MTRLSHRAATTGSAGFVSLLLNPPEGAPKTRLNTADRIGENHGSAGRIQANRSVQGNTPLHLAMESGHAEAAVLLIEAGADRHRVRASFLTSPAHGSYLENYC